MSHPKYRNPTIQEAIFDIRFQPPQGRWNPLFIGNYYDKVKDHFPILESVSLPMMQFTFGSGGSSEPPPTPQVYRYKSSDHSKMLQLTEGHFVVNVIGAYPGWNVFRENIEYASQQMLEVVQPEAIGRIGLRYINRFDLTNTIDTESLQGLLKSTQYVPESVLSSLSGFSHIQVKPASNKAVKVVIGDAEASQGARRSIIFDIDYALEGLRTMQLETILEEAEQLHDDVWNIFSAAKDERLERLLQGDSL